MYLGINFQFLTYDLRTSEVSKTINNNFKILVEVLSYSNLFTNRPLLLYRRDKHFNKDILVCPQILVTAGFNYFVYHVMWYTVLYANVVGKLYISQIRIRLSNRVTEHLRGHNVAL